MPPSVDARQTGTFVGTVILAVLPMAATIVATVAGLRSGTILVGGACLAPAVWLLALSNARAVARWVDQ